MRKIFVLVIFSFLTVGYGQDQLEEVPETVDKFSWGIKAGLNYARLTDQREDANNLGRFGLLGGGYMRFGLNTKWNFQPELLYSMQGTVIDYNRFGAQVSRATRLDYIQLPLMMQYKMLAGYYLEFGPQIGYIITARNLYNSGPNVEVKENFYDQTNPLDIGANLGIGWEGEGGFNANFRMGYGFLNANDEIFTDQNWNSLVISLGIGFTLGKD